jgi:hypothetical protein
MNLLKKINNLFSYDKYYKMSNDDLTKEAGEYALDSCYTQYGGIVRSEVIKQLIAKDNASMFKKSLIISSFTLIVALISLIVSLISIFSK